jgi:hypothetical protein
LEVDVQQGNFKILRLFPQVLILFLGEKWIPPSSSETAEIGKKIEGILGVKITRCSEDNIMIGKQGSTWNNDNPWDSATWASS